MKTTLKTILPFFLLIAFTLTSCDDDDDIVAEDDVANSVNIVKNLKATPTDLDREIAISWTNPDDEDLIKVEISYKKLETGLSTKASPTSILVDAKKGEEAELKITVSHFTSYIISAVAINKAGVQSKAVNIGASPNMINQGEDASPIFLRRADTLMTSMVQLYLNNNPRDIWNSNYPRTSGYWDGAAVIWGHGAVFSGYAALREAAEGFTQYKTKYETLYDNRFLSSIDQFRNRRDGNAEAYAVYPGDGDERYYDDNVWVGLDMVDLYLLTKDSKYLDRAKLVWDFILVGTDDVMGGGVYWVEGGKSKHTCSTAPSAVLAAKLYQATNEAIYLQNAKDLYAWGKKILQDPSDYLYWDNARLSDENDPDSEIEISKSKYSYNSGQPMQAAALLYKITGEAEYLSDAQNIAKSAYKKWFIPFNSYLLGESFHVLEPGHVWFQAIMLRGFIELYKMDNNRTYVTAYEKTLSHAWLSDCRDRNSNLLNSDFRGGTSQGSWEALHEGACIEMLARLASLRRDGL